MFAESSLHLAIQDLGIHEPTLLAADRLPRHERQTPDHSGTSSGNDLYVRLGVPLPVSVETGHSGIFVRGDLEKMNWAPYEAISRGLRKLIAARLNVDVEALAMNKLLVVETDHATQYVEIVVPPDHGQDFSSADTQGDVDTFLRVVKGEPLHPSSGDSLILAQPPAAADRGCDDGPRRESCQSRAADFAREVRAAVGGKTLPAACTIDSPGWSSPMQLSGKLGDRPPKQRSEPEQRVIDCHIDGYLKSQRLVHLIPVSAGNQESAGVKRDGRKTVAFDEEQWFEVIATLAAKRGLVVRATYRCVSDGKKELLQLVDLEVPVAAVQSASGDRASSS